MPSDALSVDGPLSLAWREKGLVHLVVHLGDADLATGQGTVRFRQQGHSFRRTGTLEPSESGTVLRVRIPLRHFNQEAWSMALRPADTGPFRRLDSRILARPAQPVALLHGPRPRPGLAPPEPQRQTVRQSVRRARRLAGRARRAAAAGLGR